MLRHVFYAVAAVLLLNAASAAFADDSAPSADATTAVHQFAGQLQDLKKSFDTLSKTIDDGTKTLDTQTDLKAAQDQIATLKASISTLLGQVVDDGPVAQYGANALARSRSKLKSLETNTTLTSDERKFLTDKWKALETDTQKAVDELTKVRTQFVDLLKGLQHNQEFLEELQQLGVAEKALQTIRQITQDIRSATQQLKALIGQIKSPGS